MSSLFQFMTQLYRLEVGFFKFAIEPNPASDGRWLFISQSRYLHHEGLTNSDAEPPTAFGVITDVYSTDCGLRFALTPYGIYEDAIVADSPEALLAEAAGATGKPLLVEAQANHLLECSPEAKARELMQAMTGFSKGQAPFAWRLEEQSPDYEKWPGPENLQEAPETLDPDLSEL